MIQKPNDLLWQRIQHWQPDEPNAVHSFSQKLSAQQNWNIDYTRRCIDEYKKFMYLCCVLPAGASPPPDVDEVWHLHLTYTKSYWQEFCPEVLQKQIHHQPSTGGAAEKEKYSSLYADTCTAYENYFGPPPADIWPKPAANADVTTEPGVTYQKPAFLLPMALLLLPFAYSLVVCGRLNPYHLAGPEFLVFFLLLAVCGIIVVAIQQHNKLGNQRRYIHRLLQQGYSIFTLTHCFYGNERLLRLSLLDLVQRGKISVCEEEQEMFLVHNLDYTADEQNPLLPLLAERYVPGSRLGYEAALAIPMNETPATEALKMQLTGLALPPDPYKLIVPGIILLAGLARIGQGLYHSKPVSLLILECALFLVVVIRVMQILSLKDKVMSEAVRLWAGKHYKSQDLLTHYSINGMTQVTLLTIPGLMLMQHIFAPAAPADPFGRWARQDNGWGGDSSCSSSGCGSSCGSSCGSGCGGCGGGD